MTSLESALKKARVSIIEGESIVIDRSQYASRHKGKLCAVTVTRTEQQQGSSSSSSSSSNSNSSRYSSSNSGGEKGSKAPSAQEQQLSPEAQYWRHKFMNLKRELKEEEEDAEHLVEVTAERVARLGELARLLQRKIDLLVTAAGQGDGAGIACGASLGGPDTVAKLAKQRRLLRFYEQMTGLTLQEEGEGAVKCTVRNRAKRLVTRFRVAEDGDGGECTYFPLANVALLPEYLRNEIRCEAPMLSVILSDVLQSLYEDDE